MPGLNFLITGDDSDIRKKLKRLAADAAKSGGAAAQAALDSANKAFDTEKVQRKNVLKLINDETEAIKRRNAEEAKGGTAPKLTVTPQSSSAPITRVNPAVTYSKQDLINQFKQAGYASAAIQAQFDAGRVSADKYKLTIDALSAKQAELRKALQDYDIVQTEAAETTQKTTKEQQKQIGILQRLTGELKTFKEQKFGLTNFDDIAKANARIEELEGTLKTYNNVGKTGFDELGNKIDSTSGKIDRLKKLSANYQLMANAETDINKIAVFNSKAQQAADTAKKLGNVGKAGFDELGNAIEKNSGTLGKVFSGLRKIAEVLPGIGFYGLLAFAIEPLLNYISNLNLFSDRLNQGAQNLKSLNDVMLSANKVAGAQIGILKQLYDAATNTNKSFKERIEAAEQLRDSYAAEFQNATALEIINGKLKDSYDDLTKSIIAMAKSQAASSKIADLEGKNLDDQFQIDKNNAIKAQRNAQAYADYKIQLANQSDASAAASAKGQATYRTSAGVFATPATLLKRGLQQIKEQTDISNLVPAQNIAVRDKTVAFLEGYVKNVTKSSDDLKNANKLLGDQLQNFDRLIAGVKDKQQLDNIQNALQIKLNQVGLAPGVADKIRADLQKVEELEKKYNPKPNDGVTAENQYQSALAKRVDVINQIKAAQADASAKSKTQEQQELDANAQKFVQLRDNVIKYNTWVANYNKNKPKSQQVSAIGLDQIEPIKLQADENIRAQIQLEKQKVTIEQLKQQYEQYEDFKLQRGKETADIVYSDLLKNGSTYMDYLKNLKPADSDKTPYAAKLTDFLNKELPEASANANKVIAGNIQQMINDTITFEQRASVISAIFLQKVEQLEKAAAEARLKGNNEYADQLDQTRAKISADGEIALTQLVLQHRESLDSYENMYDQVKDMSLGAALFAIDQAKNRAKEDKNITDGERDEILKKLDQVKAKMDFRTVANGLSVVGAAFDEIGNSISALDPKLGNTFKSIGNIIGTVGELGKAAQDIGNKLSNFSKTKGENGGGFFGTVSAVTDMVPVVGKFISLAVTAVSSVVKFFKAAHETAVQSQKQLDAYNKSLIVSAVAYNELLRDRLRSQGDINKMTMEELKLREQMLAQQKDQAQADFNNLLALIQNSGQQITGEHTEKYGGFLGIAKKTKVVQDLAGLNTADYDTLEKLYTQGKLTDQTKAWFEELKKVHDELGDIGVSAQEAADQLAQAATGTTADAISDAILEGLKNGKRSLADFADDFKSMMQESAYSMFKNNVLSGLIANFYKQFSDAAESDGGLTDDKIAQLKSNYADAIDKASKQFDDLEKVVGSPIATNAANSLSGAIQGMSQQTAELLAGQLGGLRIAQLQTNTVLGEVRLTLGQQLEIAMQGVWYMEQIAANTLRTADNTEMLNTINKALASIDKKMNNNYNNLSANGLI